MQINSVNGQILYRVVMCAEHDTTCISVKTVASCHVLPSQEIPVTVPALTPKKTPALRVSNEAFDTRGLRVSTSASGQDEVLKLPICDGPLSQCGSVRVDMVAQQRGTPAPSVPPFHRPHAWIWASFVCKAATIFYTTSPFVVLRSSLTSIPWCFQPRLSLLDAASFAA